MVVLLWHKQLILYNFVRKDIEITTMKKPILIITFLSFLIMSTTSCNLFKKGSGCPTNGKNVGAEKLVSGDPAAEKAARKAKKFKS
jgi:hypothetical protein